MSEAVSILAEMAHEFQTPLAILKGSIEILAPRKEENGAKESSAERAARLREVRIAREHAARTAQATLDRLSRLVQDLLETARLNISRDAALSMPIDIAALIRETYDDCAILAEDKNIALTVASENVWIDGDRDKLKEVLLNLISNALKYTPRGGSISLTAKTVSGGSGQSGEAEIAVEDSGIGIAEEFLPRIFERFYRIKSSVPTEAGVRDELAGHSGTGLGLHICKQIIEAHQGMIAVESALGKGSRFIVRLPKSTSVVLAKSVPSMPSVNPGKNGDPERSIWCENDRDSRAIINECQPS